jgi:AraC-like DNA-binding protein
MEKPFNARLLLAQINSLLTNRKNVREFCVQSPLAQSAASGYSNSEEKFLSILTTAIETHIEDPGLDIGRLAGSLNMSKATLYRKIKGITDLSPLEFINRARLNKAAMLLAQQDHKVYEVAMLTGFNSRSSFFRNFQKLFKLTPTEFVRERLGIRREAGRNEGGSG